jgi:stringent starvation protein B
MKKASQVIFNLSESAVNDINLIKKVVVLAQFNTPDGAGLNQQVQIPAGAFLAVKLRAAFEFKAML